MENSSTQGVILVVDDDREVTLSLNGFLTAIGYKMLTAFKGDEALKIIESVGLDLVVLDINMPGINGIEILKRIHAKPRKPKVIVITGFGDEYKSEVEALGVDGFFTKPIDFSRFLDRIRYILSTTDKTTIYDSKSKEEQKPETGAIPKAKVLFLEPNPIVFGLSCGYFMSEGLVTGEYEIKVEYGDRKGLNVLYDNCRGYANLS